jgi:hypothetical protein
VSEIVRFVESFLPRSLHWWTDWYAGNPEWFAGGVAAVTVFTLAGSKLSARISDLMRIVWNSKGATDPVPRNTFHDVIFAIRTSRVYQAIIWAGRRHVVPLLSVLALSLGRSDAREPFAGQHCRLSRGFLYEYQRRDD